MAGNALQLVALLLWPAACHSLQRCCDGQQRAVTRNAVAAMAGNAPQLAALLRRWPATRYNLRHCYDGRQRATTCSVAMMAGSTLQPWPTLRWSILVFFFFFLLDNFKREKEREKKKF